MTETLIARGLSDRTFQKLHKKKEEDGFKDDDWNGWLSFVVRDVNLVETTGERISKGTKDNLLKTWVQNFGENCSRIRRGKSLDALVPPDAVEIDKGTMKPPGSAIIVGRGPSIFEKKHLELLAESDYHGCVICTDGSLIDTLKAGVVPDDGREVIAVTVDGNREKIWKWYDDPIVDKYGPNLKVILSTTAAVNVAERIEKTGAQIFWFLPIHDDFRMPQSFTEMQRMMTATEQNQKGVIMSQAGGHAGATAYIQSWALLRRSPVALIGLNLGYTKDTKLESTYYWPGLMESAKGDVAAVRSVYKTVVDPNGEPAIMDPVFLHYQEAFLNLVQMQPWWVRLINCTEGGAIFGRGIEWWPFKKFLEEYKN